MGFRSELGRGRWLILCYMLDFVKIDGSVGGRGGMAVLRGEGFSLWFVYTIGKGTGVGIEV